MVSERNSGGCAALIPPASSMYLPLRISICNFQKFAYVLYTGFDRDYKRTGIGGFRGVRASGN